jgi:ketosteroid isomerase-like protein
MKPFRILVIILLQTSVFTTLEAQSKVPADSLELIKVFQAQIGKWKEGYNSGDARNLISLYSADAQYISSHVTGLVAPDREKLIANFQNGITGGGHIDSLEILRMDSAGDLATLLCKYQATNSGVTYVGRNLLVLKKTDGNWLIILHMTVV